MRHYCGAFLCLIYSDMFKLLPHFRRTTEFWCIHIPEIELSFLTLLGLIKDGENTYLEKGVFLFL